MRVMPSLRSSAILSVAMRIQHGSDGEPPPDRPDRIVATIDATELGGLFSVPQWLRDLGLMTWLVVS